MSEIQSFVESIFDELVAIRRDIHAHPEVGMTEVRTSALIRSELEKMGVDEIQQPLPTAVVGLIHGTKGPGRCVALRADIDALPVHEETGLPFSSVNEGVMHACGHDLHTTMLLGAAKTLCHMRDQFAGTVKLIFEPSEDTMPGGARKLVARQLGQPERRLREQTRCGVGRLVPCLKDGRILEPEVGREVDHAYAAGDEPGRQAERRRVRHCQKGHVAAVEGGLVERAENQVGHAGESGVRLRDRRAGQRVGGDRNQLEVGVTHEQAHELDARETGRADH